MTKSTKTKINHIIWLIVFFIVAIFAVSVSVIQSNKSMANNVKEVNYYLLRDELKYNMKKYGLAKYYPKHNSIIFIAKPNVAKSINHTKISNNKPIKINNDLRKINNKLKKQTKISSIKIILKAQHQRYIIEEK